MTPVLQEKLVREDQPALQELPDILETQVFKVPLAFKDLLVRLVLKARPDTPVKPVHRVQLDTPEKLAKMAPPVPQVLMDRLAIKDLKEFPGTPETWALQEPSDILAQLVTQVIGVQRVQLVTPVNKAPQAKWFQATQEKLVRLARQVLMAILVK